MGSPDFAQCALEFQTGLYANYVYTGPVTGVLKSTNVSLITVEGCRLLCGTGNEYYDWADSASTISTWVLPILGLLLQAPYESNAFAKTMWATARWVGSPIASLSYTLWNIKNTSKCAMMVDMATKYDEYPDEKSQYSQIRDSLYMLSVMNQYTIAHNMPSIEAEKLLRVALFSDSLQMAAVEGEFNTLVGRRRELARVIRDGRKKGIVPVFISLGWFLFSLAISMQSAYGQLGDNATAHDLALGLLLCYFPVLILCTIVDRNPTNAESIQEELNRLLDAVRTALINPELRTTYIKDTNRKAEDFAWTDILSDERYFSNQFFTAFAGQGRIRFHYGVAHPILAGMERSFVANYGRDWFHDSDRARVLLVDGPRDLHGLRTFDPRECWQVLSAFTIVSGSSLGAFLLSYFTPTVGLGCRSGGYVVFNVIALGTFGLEALVWWRFPANSRAQSDVVTKIYSTLDKRLTRSNTGHYSQRFGDFVHRRLRRWSGMTNRDRFEELVLRLLEVANTGWLSYIIFAQVFGSYQNCDCMASIWGPNGGYVDFEDYNYYRSQGVAYYWGFGTGLSCFVMGVSFGFIVLEWCTQSHLSTDEYANAQAGLRRVRAFKKNTYYFRTLHNHVIEAVKLFWRSLGRNTAPGKPPRTSLVWACHTKAKDPEAALRLAEEPSLASPLHTGSGSSYGVDGVTLVSSNMGELGSGVGVGRVMTRREEVIRSGIIRPKAALNKS